jgi:hypothetical protein
MRVWGSIALTALAALAALALTAGPASSKPPKPKPPTVALLTGTEQGVLRRGGIKVEVTTRRGAEARVEAGFVVDGFPEDYAFRLGPERAKLENNRATVRFKLSPRMKEVLDFAIKSCRGASLSIEARVGERVGRLSAGLRRPREC